VYGKIFESIYDGTLSADWKAMITFQQLIVLADQDGTVDMTPPAISRRTGIPLDIIEHGIEKLQEPDKWSRSELHEGRRIILLDDHRPWGWEIVNYEHYKNLATRDDKREKARERKRRQRERQVTDYEGCHAPVTPCHTESRVSRHVDVDTDVDVDEEREGALANANGSPNRVLQRGVRVCPKWFTVTDDLQRYAESKIPADLVPNEVEKFRNYEFPRPRKDWEATFRNWICKAAERNPKPKAANEDLRWMARFND